MRLFKASFVRPTLPTQGCFHLNLRIKVKGIKKAQIINRRVRAFFQNFYLNHKNWGGQSAVFSRYERKLNLRIFC